jgi:hypothetical protein
VNTLQKKTAEMAGADPGAGVFFFDEARLGAKPALGRRRTRKGGRPIAVVGPGHRNFHAYSAVCPATGEGFSLPPPRVDAGAMNAFLGEMAGALGGRRCVLAMDRAGRHVSRDLKAPPNIRTVLLPPHSPELSPAERPWRWIRRHAVRNRPA